MPVIRPYRPADEDAIVRVFLASTIPGQAFLPETFWRAQAAEVRERFLPVAETWVVEEEGEVVAFASLLGDVLGGLFTLPERQGAGHGRALVEHAHARHDPLVVEVFEANARAVGFYRHLGFANHERQTHAETGLGVLLLRLSGAVDTR